MIAAAVYARSVLRYKCRLTSLFLAGRDHFCLGFALCLRSWESSGDTSLRPGPHARCSDATAQVGGCACPISFFFVFGYFSVSVSPRVCLPLRRALLVSSICVRVGEPSPEDSSMAVCEASTHCSVICCGERLQDFCRQVEQKIANSKQFQQ